jgi:hypothetical protein
MSPKFPLPEILSGDTVKADIKNIEAIERIEERVNSNTKVLLFI